MSNAALAFDGFLLEPDERRLTRAGVAVEVSGRYLDALLLLARHPGELITKDRFMAEVWRGVPVTDEALTQCIRSLRKALGDQAARPRFIETIPRHGYRFVAEVTARSSAAELASPGSAAQQVQSEPATPSAPAASAASPSALAAFAATPSPPPIIQSAEPSAASGQNDLKGNSSFNSQERPRDLLGGAASSGGMEGQQEPVVKRAAPSAAGSNAQSGTQSEAQSAEQSAAPSAAPSIAQSGAQAAASRSAQNDTASRPELLLIAAAGLVGGAAAGLIGGVGYGLIAATEPPAGTGAVSILLVMTCLCLLVGVLGGLGVGSGAALGRLLGPGRLFPLMAGGGAGGLVVGALGRLIGLDAFSLLIGSRPLAITGGSEGLIIGALAGAALWLAEREPAAPPSAAAGKGALLGALAGLLVTLGGGKMMAGSLAGLAAAHPDAPLGAILSQFSPALLLVAGAVEGAIFIAALTLAFVLVLRARETA